MGDDVLISLFFRALLFAAALSLDTLVAAATLGAQKIDLPFRSLLGMSFVCSAGLTLSMWLGDAVGGWMTAEQAKMLGSLVLIVLGAVRLCAGIIKKGLRKLCEENRSIQLHFAKLTVFLKVCVDSAQADFNRSQSLSLWEAMSLAAALSLDGIAAGFGAGMLRGNIWIIAGLSFAVQFGAAKIGWILGKQLSRKSDRDLSIAAGCVLILLGLGRAFGK